MTWKVYDGSQGINLHRHAKVAIYDDQGCVVVVFGTTQNIAAARAHDLVNLINGSKVADCANL